MDATKTDGQDTSKERKAREPLQERLQLALRNYETVQELHKDAANDLQHCAREEAFVAVRVAHARERLGAVERELQAAANEIDWLRRELGEQ